jgi:ABC-2 type transport system permease protein
MPEASAPFPVFSPWIAFRTLLQREVRRYLKLAVQTLVAPFLSNLLFLGVFGGLMAARGGTAPAVPHLRFLVPGLVVMGTLLSAFQNPLFSLVAMKYQNTLQDLGQYPLSAASRFLAFALAGALRGCLVGLMTYAAAGLFGGYAPAHGVLFGLHVAVLAFVAASGGVLAGLLLDSFERTNLLVSLVLTPALFLAGVFQPAGVSPVLDAVARFNPLAPLVALGRTLFLGAGPAVAPVPLALSAAFCAALVLSAAWAMKARIGLRPA